MSVKSQRRMAAKILKIGKNRVRMDPERIDEIELAISRDEIRRLIRDKAIRKLPKKGISRTHARVLHDRKKQGKRRGLGSRQGKKGARTPSKKVWMNRIRALRKRLRELRDTHSITEDVYRKLYAVAKSGIFHSVSDLERYINNHNLRRRR